MLRDNSHNMYTTSVQTCLDENFPDLCDHKPVINDHWILYTTGCNVTLHSTTAELKQVISLKKCQTIYKCWLVFDNTSVCLYLSSESNLQPAGKRLYLDVLYTQQGKWMKFKYSRRVFTFRTPIKAISSSVALCEDIDDEKGRIAKFIMGNGERLWTVILLLDSLSAQPELKYPILCNNRRQVVQISQVGTNNVIVFCENQIISINFDTQKSLDITPTELSDVPLHSAKSFISKSGKTAFVTVTSQHNTTNCFIFLDMQHPSSHCKVVPNNDTVTDGVFIDEQFIGVINHTTIRTLNATFAPGPFYYDTTITDVCPTSDCYLQLYQTKRLLYIYGQTVTTVLDKRTYQLVTVQNSTISIVLPMVEEAYNNCSRSKLLPISSVNTSISPTATRLWTVVPSTGVQTTADTSDTNPSQSTISSATAIIYSITSATSYATTTSTEFPPTLATANFQISPPPPSATNDDEIEIIFFVILVTVPIVGLLLTLVVVFCCYRSLKKITREQMLVRRELCYFQLQAPLQLHLLTHYLYQPAPKKPVQVI